MMLIQYLLPVALLHFMPVIGKNSVCRTLEPVGMESRIIGDDQLTASEHYANNDRYSPKQARLNRNDYCWVTGYDPTDPWIQVDFLDMGKEVIVTGIQTQGTQPSHITQTWVSKLKIQTGYSESNLTYIMDGDKPKIFGANSDAIAIVNITFPTPVSARYLRIKPTDWHRKDVVLYVFVAFRFEVLGCYETEWSSWGAWGSCSKTCGDGTKTRSRNCPESGECSGSSTNSTSCNIPICGSQTNVGSISIAVIVVIVSGVTVLLAVFIIIIIFFKKKHGGRNRKQTRSQSITHTYFDSRSLNPDTVGLEDDPENPESQSICHTYFDNQSFNPHTVGHEADPENPDTLEHDDPDEDEPEYEDVGSSEWDIAWEDLNLSGKILGKGNFGDVQLAQVKIRGKWIKAAVKTLKDGTPESERALFKEEFDTMTKIGHHPNVVNILGSCEHAGSFYVVLEYVHHGNLRKFLRKCRKEAKQISQRGLRSTVAFDLSPEQLLHFAIGVSKAMMHIADCGIIHRDLAARNILVARGFIPKVSDFGMSREEDVYTQTSSRRVPTRWLSIESLTKKMYSTQSDVWSFGILLWEIATFGGTPYSGMETRRLARHLRAGYRMPKPENCEDDMYQLMLQCWQEDPNARPTFKDIVTILSNMAEQDKIYMSTHVYENFKYAAIRLDQDDR